MKIAVTGGSGFIGSHLTDKLMESGHEVISLGRSKEPHRDNINFQRLDISDIKDLESLNKAFRGVDVVYHLAAINDPKEVVENTRLAKIINETGTKNVFLAARKNNVNRVIFSSTVWVYGAAEKKPIHSEQDTINLLSSPHPYTSSKITGEMICHEFSFLGQASTVLRYGIPYGPRMKENAVINIFLKKALKNELITLHGGTQHRPFMYIDDLVEGNVAALEPIAKNKTYNLATREYSLLELTETIKEFFPNLKVEVDESKRREGDYEGGGVTSNLANTELKWQANTPLKQGIEKYIPYLITGGL